jgi:hypothetical protein
MIMAQGRQLIPWASGSIPRHAARDECDNPALHPWRKTSEATRRIEPMTFANGAEQVSYRQVDRGVVVLVFVGADEQPHASRGRSITPLSPSSRFPQ